MGADTLVTYPSSPGGEKAPCLFDAEWTQQTGRKDCWYIAPGVRQIHHTFSQHSPRSAGGFFFKKPKRLGQAMKHLIEQACPSG